MFELKHGDSVPGTRLYKSWKNMRTRCNNKNNKRYKDYGGRGIKICNEWDNYLNFRSWAMANKYTDNLTLERTDNNKGYYPDNCKWATYKEQGNNTRKNHNITYNGETKTMQEWADYIGINYCTLRSRINLCGWAPEKALELLMNESCVYVTFKGKTLSKIQWAKESGIPYHVLLDRLNKLKWPFEKAITIPALKQVRNGQSNMSIEHKGKTLTIKQWSEEIGIKFSTLYSRIIKLNWPIELAFKIPVSPSNKLKKEIKTA